VDGYCFITQHQVGYCFITQQQVLKEVLNRYLKKFNVVISTDSGLQGEDQITTGILVCMTTQIANASMANSHRNQMCGHLVLLCGKSSPSIAKEKPYTDMSDQDVIKDAIKGTSRKLLADPAACPPEVYEIMLTCCPASEQPLRNSLECFLQFADYFYIPLTI